MHQPVKLPGPTGKGGAKPETKRDGAHSNIVRLRATADCERKLLPDAEPPDDVEVALWVDLPQIVQQPPSTADHRQ